MAGANETTTWGPRRSGVELPLDGQAATAAATRTDEGRAVQEQIVGADRVPAHVRIRGR